MTDTFFDVLIKMQKYFFSKSVKVEKFTDGFKYSVDVSLNECDNEQKKIPSLSTYQFSKALLRSINKINNECVVSIIPNTENTLFITIFHPIKPNQILTQALEYVCNDLYSSISFKIQKLPFEFDPLTAKNAIENLIYSKLEENKFFIINSDKNYIVNDISCSGLSLTNFVVNISSDHPKPCISQRLQKSSHVSKNDTSNGTMSVSISAEIQMISSLKFKIDAKKKRFEPEPVFVLPRFSRAFAHETTERKSWMKNYWFYSYGIEIDEKGTDLLCSFSGYDDDAVLEYPAELVFQSRIIEKHCKTDVQEFKEKINELLNGALKTLK